MYPVIIELRIDTNREGILTMLNQEIVPTARQLPGFASGSWLRVNGGHGTAVLDFDSQQAARAAAGHLRAIMDGMVELRSVRPLAEVPVVTVETAGVYWVVAQALPGEMTISSSAPGIPANPLPGGRAGPAPV
jgi:hypothetical protein